MRFYCWLMLISAALATIPSGQAEPLPPLKEGIWARYEGGTGGVITRSGGGVTQFDGFLPLLSVRYDGVRGGAMQGRLRTPLEGGPRFEFPEQYRGYRGDRLNALFAEEPYLLFSLLDHYRPDVVFETRDGAFVTESSAQSEAHGQCRRRLHEQYLPSSTRREDDVPVAVAAALLQIRALPLETTALSPERLAEEATGTGWASERIKSHGIAFEYIADMTGTVSPVVTALCTPNTAAGTEPLVSDQCTIRGVMDREDGWPIRLFIARRSRTEGALTFGNDLYLHRRPAYPQSGLPENPCGEAVSGEGPSSS